MHKYKKAFLVLMVIFLSGIVCPPGILAQNDVVIAKIASLAPKNVGWARNIRKIIMPAIKRVTKGQLRIKWYWGGIKGDDADYLVKMKNKELDGGAFTGYGVAQAIPEMEILELPFMFKNYQEVDYIRDKMMARFDGFAQKRGLKLIMWADQDFDQIYSTKFRMANLNDFKSARVLNWYGPLEYKMFQELGATDIITKSISATTSAIRKGEADTFIAPAVWMVGSQLYTSIKFINPLKVRYSPSAMIINMQSWNKLSPAVQETVIKMRKTVFYDFLLKCRKDNKLALKALDKYGLTVSKMNFMTRKEIENKCKRLWDLRAGKSYSKDLLEELKSHLKDFRASK